jgi:hypothetical protein
VCDKIQACNFKRKVYHFVRVCAKHRLLLDQMTRSAFEQLFTQALAVAARNAESKLGTKIPHAYRIEFHGLGHGGDLISVEDAVNALYLGPTEFFRIVDVAVVSVSPHVATVFVRVSGHKPSSFKETLNESNGMGPFNQLIADDIKLESA